MGFDPLMVMGGAVILGGLVGFLVGPFIGSSIFRLTNRAQLKQFELKNTEFLSRLRIKDQILHHKVFLIQFQIIMVKKYIH